MNDQPVTYLEAIENQLLYFKNYLSSMDQENFICFGTRAIHYPTAHIDPFGVTYNHMSDKNKVASLFLKEIIFADSLALSDLCAKNEENNKTKILDLIFDRFYVNSSLKLHFLIKRFLSQDQIQKTSITTSSKHDLILELMINPDYYFVKNCYKEALKQYREKNEITTPIEFDFPFFSMPNNLCKLLGSSNQIIINSDSEELLQSYKEFIEKNILISCLTQHNRTNYRSL